jgi:hypothetical protein
MECLSLSRLINVGLKSTLPVFGAIGLVNLPAFHPMPRLISVSEMGLLLSNKLLGLPF